MKLIQEIRHARYSHAARVYEQRGQYGPSFRMEKIVDGEIRAGYPLKARTQEEAIAEAQQWVNQFQVLNG